MPRAEWWALACLIVFLFAVIGFAIYSYVGGWP